MQKRLLVLLMPSLQRRPSTRQEACDFKHPDRQNNKEKGKRTKQMSKEKGNLCHHMTAASKRNRQNTKFTLSISTISNAIKRTSKDNHNTSNYPGKYSLGLLKITAIPRHKNKLQPNSLPTTKQRK